MVFDRGNNSPVHLTPCQLWEGVRAHSDPFGPIAPGNFLGCNGLSWRFLVQASLAHSGSEDFLGEARPPETLFPGLSLVACSATWCF